MTRKYIITFISIGTIIVLLILGDFFLQFIPPHSYPQMNSLYESEQDCEKPPQIIQESVVGVSMHPLIKDGQTVDIMTNYHDCTDLKRGDVVIYNYGGGLRKGNPLIKRIVGIGGDRFSYSSGYIIINDVYVKNSEGNPYIISSNMMKLYAQDYPILPSHTFLLLGDRVGGTTDSSVFGLVSETDIIGKVVRY